MSLLGNLMKSVEEVADAVKKIDKDDLKKAVDAVKDSIPDEVKNAVKDAAAQTKKETAPKVQAASQVTSMKQAGPVTYETVSYEGVDKENYNEYLPEDDMDAEVKILEVLAKDFPQYEVRKNVSPTTIGGTGKFLDYSIGIYKDGAPKLFIMLVGSSTTKHREYRWSKEEAEKAGIPMINFVYSMPNRYWYIADRLAKYL